MSQFICIAPSSRWALPPIATLLRILLGHLYNPSTSAKAIKEKHLSYNNSLYHALSLSVLVYRKCILIN